MVARKGLSSNKHKDQVPTSGNNHNGGDCAPLRLQVGDLEFAALGLARMLNSGGALRYLRISSTPSTVAEEGAVTAPSHPGANGGVQQPDVFRDANHGRASEASAATASEGMVQGAGGFYRNGEVSDTCDVVAPRLVQPRHQRA